MILAGGKGSRLEGVMPPYWKPLLPHQGRCLINKIYEQVRPHTDRVFVVVAPENALQISQVLPKESGVIIVVQPEAKGPGDALVLALRLTKSDKVLVVMGDNLMPDDDIKRVCAAVDDSSCGFVIGTGTVPNVDAARRFTRVYDRGAWVHIEEGPQVTPGEVPYVVWCGPLVLPVEYTLTAMERNYNDVNKLGERKIGTHLGDIGTPKLVPCDAIDVGTPETVLEVTT